MQLFILFGVFAAFVVLGVYIWFNFQSRKAFFESVVAFCNHLSIEISFSKNTIGDIINRYGASYSKQFRRTLDGYSGLLENKADITNEVVCPLMWNRLKGAERANLVNFFCELGRHGVMQEQEKLETNRMTFQGFLSKATQTLQAEANVYLKLCIILGVGAVILLI